MLNQALCLITGAVKSTPINSMQILTQNPPISLKLEEQALLQHEKLVRPPQSKWTDRQLTHRKLKTQTSFLEKVTDIKTKFDKPYCKENILTEEHPN